MSSLPATPVSRASDKEVNQFFDKYYTKSISYPANEVDSVDSVVTFFEKRGFDKSAAINVATVLLQQAKIDKINVFRVIDTLKGLDEVQLSAVVAEVLNYNRAKTSTLGYRRTDSIDKTEKRNIRV